MSTSEARKRKLDSGLTVAAIFRLYKKHHISREQTLTLLCQRVFVSWLHHAPNNAEQLIIIWDKHLKSSQESSEAL